MEKVSARGVEVEAAAAARFDQFRGLPVKGDLPDVSDGPLAHIPTDADQRELQPPQSGRLVDGLLVESDTDRKLKDGAG